MGDTLQELRNKLKKEKVKTQAKKDIVDIGKERKKFKQRIRRERFQRKFGGLMRAGRVVAKGSVGTARGLSKVATAINEAEKLRHKQLKAKDRKVHKIAKRSDLLN